MSKPVKSASGKTVMAIAFTVFMLYCLFILFFLVFAILLAIKPSSQSFIADKMAVRLFSWPEGATLRNFYLSFEQFTIGTHSYIEMLFNSIWRSLGGTFIGWFFTAMVTYILVFFRCRFTKFVYALGFFLSTFPLYGAGPAEYRLYTQLGFINSPLILLNGITLYGAYFFYMYAFWKGLSWGYAEAAMIDGAGNYTIFFRIMFPMAVPSMAALFIMSFISNWNNYDGTLLYMTEYPNLSYALYAYENSTKYNSQMGKPAYFAGLIISIMPSLILFLAFQNTIMERVYLGGLKG